MITILDLIVNIIGEGGRGPIWSLNEQENLHFDHE